MYKERKIRYGNFLKIRRRKDQDDRKKGEHRSGSGDSLTGRVPGRQLGCAIEAPNLI